MHILGIIDETPQIKDNPSFIPIHHPYTSKWLQEWIKDLYPNTIGYFQSYRKQELVYIVVKLGKGGDVK